VSNADRLHATRGTGRCLVPWILLGVVVLGLAGTLWWGYQKRETVVEYAVTSMLDRQLGELLPEGEDRTRVATRMAALLRSVQEGRLDPERLQGMGNMFRDYYSDRQLDALEFESLLAFAEAAVRP
jgi:hypothetical protein